MGGLHDFGVVQQVCVGFVGAGEVGAAGCCEGGVEAAV